MSKTAEEKKQIAFDIARKIASIPDNKPEHAADHKLMEIHRIVMNAMAMPERHADQQLAEFKKSLTPPAALEEESQEDMWRRIHYKICLEFPTQYYGQQLVKELMNEFHLTRKQQTK